MLTQFIDQWAPKMNQNYTKYDGKTSLETSTGTVYPDDLSKVTVNENKTTIGMSKDGNGENEYNVVAIYNYDGTIPPLPNHITYVFAFHNGQPVALVDQSRDGNPELKPTQNTDVQQNFEQIADNNDFTRTDDEEAAAESPSDSSQSDSSNNKQAKGNSGAKPIANADEALQIAQAAFDYAQGKTTDTTKSMDPSSGPNSDGSFTLKLYAGAKGLDVYTVKPLANNKVSVSVKFGSIQGGPFSDPETKVIVRP